MPLDPSISLSARVPDMQTGLAPFSTMIDMGRKALELRKAQDTYGADVAQRLAESDTAQAGAKVATATVQPKIDQQAAVTQGAQAQASSASLMNNQAHLNNMIENASTLLQKPDLKRSDVIDNITSTIKNYKVPSSMAAQMIGSVPDTDDPAALQDYVKKSLIRAQTASENLKSQTAQPTFIDAGPNVQAVNANPNVAMPVGTKMGAPVVKDLGPNAITTDEKGNPVYVGPKSPREPWVGDEPIGKFQGNPDEIRKQIMSMPDLQERALNLRALDNQLAGNNKPIASGAPLGLATTQEGKAQTVKAHFAESAANAASSSLLEGIAQNIKTFAPKAITGTLQERQSFVNGVLNKLGIPGTGDLKTDTDLMEKNMAQLAKNSPAASDAARVVNQLASPHPTMSSNAINDSADQIIGQVRMAKSTYDTFLPHMIRGDNDAYLEKLQKFSQVNDPRVWQFEALAPTERTAMVAAMRPEDRIAFRTKIQKAEEMGLFK